MRTNRGAQLLLSLVLATLPLRLANAQVRGEYPDPHSLATYRPVTATSVCGVDGPEEYCEYTTDATASLAPNCISQVCDNTCPHSAFSPPPVELATLGTFVGVTTEAGRPGSNGQALRFNFSFVEVDAAFVPPLGVDGFSFATWINQNEGNEGTLLSKSSPDGLERNYVLTVSQTTITLDYLPSTLDVASLPPGAERFRTASVGGLNLTPGYWHHVTVTVYKEDAAFYVNGTVVSIQSLEGEMVDVSRIVYLGQTVPSVGYYSGLMEMVYFYARALTAREVTELVTGSLPFVHLSTECHCPPSHPVIDPNDEDTCIQHTGDLTDRGFISRLNTFAHPAGFLNDFGASTAWISVPGEQTAAITINLTQSFYETIFVSIRYGAPRPKAAVLETSKDGGLTFNPIQYYADDCMLYFGLPDDGPITAADDVNCVTGSSIQTPTYNGDVRTLLLSNVVRNFNLDTSPELREFVLASHLRVRMVDYFNASTTLRHRYYSILEVAVAARCACNGHSSRCGTEIDSVCQCVHNTMGDRCEECQPLYNDKPWQYGTTSNGFPCKLCDCNGHATSCHYNASLDPFPDSYDVGGGGVCDDCQDNTTGRYCDSCRFGYYRPVGVEPSDPAPCVECGCDERGARDDGDCVKSEDIAGGVAGQCSCKENVMGLKCDVCRPGFYSLSADNPVGCLPCDCNTMGTFEASTTCNVNSGECICKTNVEGLKCDRCKNGTTGLTAINPLGCVPCSCNVTGAISNNCNANDATCTCKAGVGGDLCDQCLPGFFGFSDSGCQPCQCDPSGAISNICDVVTGECTCQENVAGASCDACVDGFYNVSGGCTPCGCNLAGTVNGTNVCDPLSGQCDCKSNVEGRTCDTCLTRFTNLSALNPDGCDECDCLTITTDTSGRLCDPVTSQCECLPTATGLRCESCRNDFYFVPSSGCVSCDCHPEGTANGTTCDPINGQCTCASNGVGGRQCSECLPGFFQYPSCASCGCNQAGAVEASVCDAVTGVCECKQYVTGVTCDTCIPGFQLLDAENPFGCTAAPDEQAPPFLTPLNSTSILLMWLEPEAPNGVIDSYNIYRDGSLIANVTETTYTDTGLTPDTVYSYAIEALNLVGSTTSVAVEARTQEGAPSGVPRPTLEPRGSTSVQASWQQPAVPNGVVGLYELVIVEIEGLPIVEDTVFSGLGFSAVVTGLNPFTEYTFVLRACTTGGCGLSEPTQVLTGEAPPTFQPAPNVTAVNATSLRISWSPPRDPNGVITHYVIYQRNDPFDGEGLVVATVTADTLTFVVGGLCPFTMYEFRVVSHTIAGGTPSEWSDGQTDQSVPDGVRAPNLLALSSSSIQVNWTEPESPNGDISLYTIYMVVMGTEGQDRVPVLFSSSPGSHIVEGLEPFTEYFFLVEACTDVGCAESDIASTFTRESAPVGQEAPTVTNNTATSVSLQWGIPLQPNGIISNYIVQRRLPSLLPAERDIGVSFAGTGLATFGSSTLGGFNNTIELRFRTLSASGTLLYYISPSQSDLMALELRDGVPWFVFDVGTGPAAIRPEADVTFNDDLWHTLVAEQRGVSGSIDVDGLYTGSGTSIGISQVLAPGLAVYIGGVPSQSPLTSSNGELNPAATLRGQFFAGCLFDVKLNNEAVDFSLQTTPHPGVGTEELGCPINGVPQTQFLGGGYRQLAENTISSSQFSLTFDFQTTHLQGLLLFGFNSSDASSFGVEIRDSFIYLLSWADGSRSGNVVSTNAVCDGAWHTLLLEQEGNQLALVVDGSTAFATFPRADIIFNSGIFIGGVPLDTYVSEVASDLGLDVYTPYSGCTRASSPYLFVDGSPVEAETVASEFVRFDQCGNSPGAVCSAPWVSMDAGQELAYSDVNLMPFTDYLYRVNPVNGAGRTFSPWVSAMTDPSAPAGVRSVSLLTSSQSSLTILWQRPAAANGLLTRYDIIAEPLVTTGLTFPTGAVVMTTLEIQEPETPLLATLSGLEPATTYSVTVLAYTRVGASRGPAVQLQTDESAPVGVQPPLVSAATARSLNLLWAPPTQPNGHIIQYSLFVDDKLQFSGLANSTIIGGLEPFTQYGLHLQACTRVGCGNSSVSVGQTLPDQPTGLAGPNLTALTPSSIDAVWSAPANPNGEILRYELHRLSGTNLSESATVFIGLELSTTIFGLTPSTTYFFQLLAFNAGGFARSPVVSIQTLEDIPDGISAPGITVISATSLSLSWEPPERPNGDINQYILLQDGEVIFNTTADLSYLVTNLTPFTTYSYSLMACTIQGCGSGNHSTATTLEAVPEGYVQPSVTSTTPTSFTVLVDPVTRPNGVVTYLLYVVGVFSAGSGDTYDIRLVYSSMEPGTAEVTSLLPYMDYEVTLVVVNSAGNLTGDPFTVRTDPTEPEGLSAPTLSLVDATTLLAEWLPPSRPNGMLQTYRLSLSNSSHQLTYEVGLNTSLTIPSLRPFTFYEVFITVNNTVGSVDSPTVNVTTGETAPSGFDQAQVVERDSRYILISWDPPAASNGILVNYTVLQGGVAIATVEPSILEYRVTGLLPFSDYTFSVRVCTAVGCVESPGVTTTTLEDVPEDVRVPVVNNGAGSTVLVSWGPPGVPNGIILRYYVERSLATGAQNFSRLGVVEAESVLVFVDDSTEPFTGYLYRVVSENSAGGTPSPVVMFVTPEAAPDGVLPPLLTVLSPTEVQVLFQPPLIPNGILISYTLNRSTPLDVSFSIPLNVSSLPISGDYFIFNDTLGILPFTNYTYVLTVCTREDCTDSAPALVTTFEDIPEGVIPPSTEALEFDSILVSWEEPERSNGEVISYNLLRRSLGFDSSDPAETNCCEEYLNSGQTSQNLSTGCSYIAEISADIRMYTDNTLQAFSFYQYCIVVTNGAGSVASDLSPPTQTFSALRPERGPRLNATTINSTAIELVWDSLVVSELLGPFVGYTLYGRRSDIAGIGEILFDGLEQTFTATGLTASTTYTFTVAVSNGRGQTFGNNASATTSEGTPMNLTDPIVLPLSATSISITWTEPQQPNGVITNYTIFLDGVSIHVATQPSTLMIPSLLPYTQYFVQFEACTQFDCARSGITAVTTLESPPRDVPSPVVVVTGPTTIDVSWSEPLMPNGNITEYRLYIVEGLEESVVFAGLSFTFMARDLRPYTSYGFRVVAVNGAGNGSSSVITVTTDEAAPSFVAPPTISVLSSSEIAISWIEPTELNGVLTGYQIYHDGFFLHGTFATFFTDTALQPFTTYTYTLGVCTNGGCTNSTAISNTTFEAQPEGISDLTVTNLQPRSLMVNWQPPTHTNGIIREYVLVLLNNGSVIFRGLALSSVVSLLTPFTSYSFQLSVCNNAGCGVSAVVDIQTPPTAPEGLDAPRLRNINSKSVGVSWSPPDFPNGNITEYVIRRGEDSIENQTIVFRGLQFSYIDTDLIPDTMYSYTVEAINNGGSTESPASYITTIADLPDDIPLPVLEVLGSTSIRVTWSPPGSPNGVISQYILYQNDVAILGIGLADFEYTATGLIPFRDHEFYLQVCNQAGCASTPPVSATTDEAFPTGVTPPTLNVLSSTAIQVSWDAPTMPNGMISRYEIRRRLLNNPLIPESIQHFGSASVLSFINIGLEPFTTYEYRLRVTNGAGSVLSDWTAITTLQDLPEGVNLPIFADFLIFARNATATWSPPTSPNGILLSYRLEYRFLLGSIITTAAAVSASVTEATATGLLPVTTYEFRVVATNAIGDGESEWVQVITGEDVPEEVQPIVVEERTSVSLVLTWDPPLTPNGVILEYRLFLDDERVYRDAAPMYTVLRLLPFTSYTLQLAACTSAGCAFGQAQSVTTAEAAPTGQPAPTLVALSPPSVEVSWDEPAQPNGIITTYEILRERTDSSIGVVVILSTSDLQTRQYTDDMVLPAMEYSYAVRVINSAGQTESEFRSITTVEAPPEGLTAPTLLARSSTSISVSWLPPSQPNGIISEYRVNRTGGGATNLMVHVGLNREFVDVGLTPFTLYSYVIEACTSGGCSIGPSSSITTLEDQPEGLSPPVVLEISATEMSIQWSPPAQPNGVIIRYTVTVNPVGIKITSTNLDATITNLNPFTVYTIQLEACNSIACAINSTEVRTSESIPGFTTPPQLVAINATAVGVSWQEPTPPNGIITQYDLRRDGVLILSTDGSTLMYTDTNLTPNRLYSYSIQAYTSIGPGAESSPREIQTPPDTPEDIAPPRLQVLGPNSILAEWTEPGKPNGVITAYILLVNGAESFRGLAFEYTVEGLTAYTDYTFRLMVCTTTCGFSDIVIERTAEAPPAGQDPPQLVANPDGSVSATWNLPAVPNGNITNFVLERRFIPQDNSANEFENVFSGLATSTEDVDPSLRPAMTYEYRVSSVNSAGTATSEPRAVTLLDAPPELVFAPVIQNILSTSLSATVAPPGIPNGQLTLYVLYQNGTMIDQTTPESQTSDVQFFVRNLQPFTWYGFHVEVCTNGGCSPSAVVSVRTAEAPPTGLEPASAQVLTSRSIEITWQAPSQPNGIILMYSLSYRLACPQPPQPNQDACVVGPRIIITDSIAGSQATYTWTGSESSFTDPVPYTAYQFQLVAVNSMGNVSSAYSEAVTTLSEEPEVIPGAVSTATDEEANVVTLDWSSAFRLNSQLQSYTVMRNGIIVHQTTLTSVILEHEPMGIRLEYTISARTTITTVTTDIYPLMLNPDQPTSEPTESPSATPDSEDDGTEFYETSAFIIGMVLVGIAVLFVAGGLLLCLIKPKGDKGYKTSGPPLLPLDGSPAHTSRVRSTSPSHRPHQPVVGSWSPGEPSWELPDVGVEDEGLVPEPEGRSYSPKKAETAALLEQEVTEPTLPDTHISGYTSPPKARYTPMPAPASHKYEMPATDDFGSFRAQQHTTFQDTKV